MEDKSVNRWKNSLKMTKEGFQSFIILRYKKNFKNWKGHSEKKRSFRAFGMQAKKKFAMVQLIK